MKEATNSGGGFRLSPKSEGLDIPTSGKIQPFYFTNPLTGFRAIQTAFTYAAGFRTRPTIGKKLPIWVRGAQFRPHTTP
jgi:hypothetical protein